MGPLLYFDSRRTDLIQAPTKTATLSPIPCFSRCGTLWISFRMSGWRRRLSHPVPKYWFPIRFADAPLGFRISSGGRPQGNIMRHSPLIFPFRPGRPRGEIIREFGLLRHFIRDSNRNANIWFEIHTAGGIKMNLSN
jgi:hypothetical protein